MVQKYRLGCVAREEDPSPLQANDQVEIATHHFPLTQINRTPGDQFQSYPDSDTLSPAIKPSEDPFLDW